MMYDRYKNLIMNMHKTSIVSFLNLVHFRDHMIYHENIKRDQIVQRK